MGMPVKGINLHDVLHLTSQIIGDVDVQKSIKVLFQELEEFARIAERELGSIHFSPNDDVGKICLKMRQRITRLRKDLVLNFGTVGNTELFVEPFEDEMDVWGMLSNISKSTVAEMHRLCDLLGFVIIPFEYLKDESFAEEPKPIQDSILKFSEIKELKPYVLCPLNHYSLYKHLTAEKPEWDIYFGEHAQSFVSIRIQFGIMRTAIVHIKALGDAVENLQNEVSSLKETVQLQGEAIQAIQDELAQIKKQQITQQMQIKKQEEAHRILQMQASSFVMMDPLLFLVKPETDIKTPSNDMVFVGPCWGPDAEEIIFEMQGLTKICGQRKALETSLLQSWFYKTKPQYS